MATQLSFERIERGEMVLQQARLRLRQPEHQVVHALLAARNGVLHAREDGVLRQSRERIVGAQQFVVDGLRHALVEGLQLLGEFVLGADDQLGRGGRRGRSQVGNKVADGEIGLVADGGDDRNLGRGNGARQTFIVEGEQVFERTAAASHDDDIDLSVPVEVAHTGAHLGGGNVALHLRRDR